jgi:hypothetical protein
MKALLCSIFYEPDVECNVCGIWSQGSFAFLNQLSDGKALLRTLIRRDPGIGALWVGAFMTGAHHKCLRRAQAAWWDIDLNVAAWTDTSMSFIQEPILASAGLEGQVSRADECRLLYLSHSSSYTSSPIVAFQPSGFTRLSDTNLDVREHVLCGKDHRLVFIRFAWVSTDQATRKQGSQTATSFRLKCSPTIKLDGIADIDYDDIDSEDEDSEMVTRNIFTWLRGENGFPVAEKEIREHPWIDNLEDDDDGDVPNKSYAGSITGITGVSRWLLKA